MWLTKVVPSILRVHWVHTGALSVDIDASGSFRGSLKRLAIAISLCNSETMQIKGKPSNSENMSKSGGHTSPMRGVLSVLGLSIDHIDPL